jgi:hypothetical protein
MKGRARNGSAFAAYLVVFALETSYAVFAKGTAFFPKVTLRGFVLNTLPLPVTLKSNNSKIAVYFCW